MKRARKAIETIVLVVIILVLLVLVVFSLFGEHMIKVAVETAGTKALNVGVELDEVDLSVFKGAVAMKGLEVSNPPGYEHEHLLELGSGKVKASLKSLMSDTVEVESINLDKINVVIEQKGLSNNLQDILKSMPKAEPKEPAEEPEKEPKKLHVKELKITGVKVNVKLLPLPGRADTIPLELDDIVMNDLGSDDKMTTAKLAKEIIVAIANGVAKKGVGILPDDMLKGMEGALKQIDQIRDVLGKEPQEMLKEGLKKGEEMLEGGTEKGKDLVEGVKGLLKPKK